MPAKIYTTTSLALDELYFCAGDYDTEYNYSIENEYSAANKDVGHFRENKDGLLILYRVNQTPSRRGGRRRGVSSKRNVFVCCDKDGKVTFFA